MNKLCVMLIAGFSLFPVFAFAGFSDYLMALSHKGSFSATGEVVASAMATDLDDFDTFGYGTSLRLGIETKAADDIALGAQLYAFKYLGELDEVFDKTASDTIRAEHAYLQWWDIANSNIHLAIGRRPFSHGLPSEPFSGSVQVDIPYGSPADFNVDGVTVGYLSGSVAGFAKIDLRLFYGTGIESEWGNGTRPKDKNLAEAQLGGINFDLLNDGRTLVQFSLYRAMGITDGIEGSVAFPTQFAALFAPSLYADIQKFPIFTFDVYATPRTEIGDINLMSLGFRRQDDSGMIWFGSLAWTRLEPNGEAGMFGGLGSDAVYQAILSGDGSEIYMVPVRAENDDSHDGYGVYVGIQMPAPLGKFGLEYNYGSRYWTPFDQAKDDVLGNKLATRGHAGEAYYIFELNANTFIKVGGIYYDFEYTGSGSPVGKPQRIADIESGAAYSLLPVVDEVWDTYAKIIFRF